MEVYKVGVKLVMTGNFAEQVAVLSKSLTGVDVKVNQLTGSFGKLQKAIAGALGVFVGEKTLGGLAALVDKTKDLSHELTQIEKLGGGANGRAADLRARQITRDVRGITEEQALHIYGQTYGLLGDAHARQVQELIAKYGVAYGNTIGNVDRGFSGSRDLVRAAEQMGRLTTGGDVDIAKFQKFVDLAARIGAATEGQVGAQQLYQMTQQAGPALMNMGDRGIATMAILSQYMGAHRAGTAMMSLNQQFAGGTMWTRNATELERLGVLQSGEWHKGGGGGIVLSEAARKRLGTSLTDPLAFVTKTLLPAMEAHGITNIDDQIREVYSILGRQTSQRVVADIIRNRYQIASEIGRLDKGMGLDDQLKAANQHDVEQALNNLSASWKNLLYAVSQSQPVIDFLNAFTDTLRSITESVRGANPDTIKAIGEGIGVLGTALIGGGAVALLAALGPAGWLATGIIALGGAVVMYSKTGEALSNLATGIKAVGVALGVGVIAAGLGAGGWLAVGIAAIAGALELIPWQKVLDGLSSGLHKLGDALSWLWDKVKNFFKNIPVPDYGPFGSPTNYTGGTGGAYLQPAMFTTSSGTRAGISHIGRAAASSPIGHAAASAITGPGGSTSAVRFMSDMINKYGWSPEAAAVMAGNVKVESNFNTSGRGDHGTSFGLAQWHLGRNLAMRAWAAAHGLPWNSVEAQESFMDHEWRQRFGNALSSHNFAALAQLGRRYEGYSTNTFGARVGYAHRFLNQFEHDGGSPAIPPTAGQSVELHANITMDGRTVAKSVTKHIVKGGQLPSTGSRLPDYQGTRPQPGLII